MAFGDESLMFIHFTSHFRLGAELMCSGLNTHKSLKISHMNNKGPNLSNFPLH